MYRVSGVRIPKSLVDVAGAPALGAWGLTLNKTRAKHERGRMRGLLGRGRHRVVRQRTRIGREARRELR